MRALLPFLFLLACPVMMIVMMRGMHSSKGDRSSNVGRVTRPGQDPSDAPGGQSPDERIAELEREVAHMRNRHDPPSV
jgi:hypothetical protein